MTDNLVLVGMPGVGKSTAGGFSSSYAIYLSALKRTT